MAGGEKAKRSRECDKGGRPAGVILYKRGAKGTRREGKKVGIMA